MVLPLRRTASSGRGGCRGVFFVVVSAMSVLRHEHARLCTREGCPTRLCWANPGPDCFAHTAPVRLPTRAAMERAAIDEFDRLMQEHPTPWAEAA